MDEHFRCIELEDQEILTSYFAQDQTRICEHTFATNYLWKRVYPATWGIVEDTLVFRNGDERRFSYTFPIGPKEQVKKALDALMADCHQRGVPCSLYLVTPENFMQLESWYPNRFTVSYHRDMADYLYETEKLATLAGKKLHGKRNHVNQFLRENEGQWTYEAMSKDNLEDCFQMALIWRKENDCDSDPGKAAEMGVAMNALRLFEELQLTGGVLRVKGEVVAFTIGEPLTTDTFVVHIEKAYADMPGAYAMINQQFVQHACRDYTYINREDDAGSAGIRQAKLSYHPALLLEKGFVTEKEG